MKKPLGFVVRFTMGLSVTLLATQVAWAQELPFLNSERGNIFSASGEWLSNNESTASNGSRVSIIEERLTLAAPLYETEKDIYVVSLKGQSLGFSAPVNISDRGLSIPEKIGSLEVGWSWNTQNADEEQTGISVQFGSSGRSLFRSRNERSISATMFSESKLSNGNSFFWIFNYANNRTVLNNLPIPTLAYLVKSDKVTWVIGLPFTFVNWRPMPFVFTAAASPFNAFAEASYFIKSPFMTYANVSWTPRAYQNLAPEGSDDRLFYEKKELGLGVRMMFSRTANIALGYSFAFDRRLALGRSLTDLTSSSTWIDDSGGFQLKARASF